MDIYAFGCSVHRRVCYACVTAVTCRSHRYRRVRVVAGSVRKLRHLRGHGRLVRVQLQAGIPAQWHRLRGYVGDNITTYVSMDSTEGSD